MLGDARGGGRPGDRAARQRAAGAHDDRRRDRAAALLGRHRRPRASRSPRRSRCSPASCSDSRRRGAPPICRCRRRSKTERPRHASGRAAQPVEAAGRRAGGAVVVPGGRRRPVRAQLQQPRLAAARLRRSGAVGADQSEPRRLPAEAELPALYARIIERVEAIPGVQSATVAMCGVMTGCRSNSRRHRDHRLHQPARRAGRVPGEPRRAELLLHRRHDDRRGPRLRRARDRQRRARSPSSTKRWCASTSRAAIRSAQRFGYDKPDIEIIGVVRDAHVNTVREAAVPMVFYPFDATPSYVGSMHVRATGDPDVDRRRRCASALAGDRAAAAGRSHRDDRRRWPRARCGRNA